jgi:hypothetical protein
MIYAGVQELDLDIELVERHRGGDDAAFSEVYERFGEMVYNVALRLSGHREGSRQPSSRKRRSFNPPPRNRVEEALSGEQPPRARSRRGVARRGSRAPVRDHGVGGRHPVDGTRSPLRRWEREDGLGLGERGGGLPNLRARPGATKDAGSRRDGGDGDAGRRRRPSGRRDTGRVVTSVRRGPPDWR